MNKLFTKIAAAFVGMAMAIGVGVAVGNKNNAKVVNAETSTGTNVTTTLGNGSGQWNAGNSWNTSAAGPQEATSSTDAAGQTWTVTYDYSTYSRTVQSGFVQFGKNSYGPTALSFATSAFTKAMKLTAFSCQYGGAGAKSQGRATLKIGSTTLGSPGALVAGANDKTVSWSDANGTVVPKDETLNVVFSDFTANSMAGGGIKVYWLKYTLVPAVTQHAVNYNKNTSDTVTGMPSAGAADENSTFTLDSSSTPIRAGYLFGGWTEDSESLVSQETIDVGTSDVTVYAIWKPISGVTVSEKTAMTGNMRGQAYYEVQASVAPVGLNQSVTWSITSSSTFGSGKTITDVASIDNEGKITFEDNATVYVWATAADGATHNATTFTVTASGLHGSSTNPYTISEARSAIDAGKGLKNAYVSGIISQVDSMYSNAITYWISDDGTTTNQFEVYRGKGLSNSNFSAASDLKVGDIVTVYGTIKKYSSTYEFDSGNYLIAFKRLSTISLTVSEAQRTFAAGDTFNYAGSVTANYLAFDGSTPAGSEAISNSEVSFHLGSSEGTVVNTSTVLKRSNNGNSIFVVYKGKSASYSLIVNDGPVTSVTLSSNNATIILGATFDTSDITVTVNENDIANPGYEWIVFTDTTTAKNYTFSAGVLTASSLAADAGIVTLRARSTSNNAKYADFTLTISAEPVVHLVNNNLSGFTTKTVQVEYASVENMSTPTSYAWTIESGTSVSIKTGAATNTLTLNCVSSGVSTVRLTVSDGVNEAHSDATITVSVYELTVNWVAPTINVYSGASLTAANVETWDVKYSSNAGETNVALDIGDFDVKLGGATISLPHVWNASDNGKTLCVEYEGQTSSTTTVSVTQALRSIYKSWTHTIVSQTWESAGSKTISGKSWSMSGTGGSYFSYEETRGQQFGSGSKPYSALSLSSSGYSGTIKSVTVYTAGAKDIVATVSVSVGGVTYGSAQAISTTNTAYVFNGNSSGSVVISWSQTSSKAIYVKQIIVDSPNDKVDIANVEGHEAAQAAVVKYAKAFNAAMDTTNNCSENMDSAWSTANAAYTTFLSDISSLSAAEQQYAKDLITYATSQWTDDTDENYAYCVERMVKTYDVCVLTHSKTAFMSAIRTPSNARADISFVTSSFDANSTSIVLVIVSLTSILFI